MQTESISKADLEQFTGSENFYRHPLVRRVIHTDGVEYLAKNAECYWLIDKIAGNQLETWAQNAPFQVWQLTWDKSGDSPVLRIAAYPDSPDSSEKLFEETLDFSTFPEQLCDPHFQLYVIDDGQHSTILLPSEY